MSKYKKAFFAAWLSFVAVGTLGAIYVLISMVIIDSRMPPKEEAPYAFITGYYIAENVDPTLLPENRMLFKNGWIRSDNTSTTLECTEYWIRVGLDWKKYNESAYSSMKGVPFPRIECVKVR